MQADVCNLCMHALTVSLHVLLSVYVLWSALRAQTAAEDRPLVKGCFFSPSAKCQKLCGGQRFELQFCLHHRGEQTRDRHAIQTPTFLIQLLNLSLTEKG